jgi:hypothetical protein
MADNVLVTQGTGTTMATDDIASVQYPRVKVSWGVDGAAVDASASNPFPVVQTGTLNVGTVTTITSITTVAPGAGTIAKSEDVASLDADVGVPSMAVRKISPANTSGTDGDYEFLQMSAGRLWASATIDSIPSGAVASGAFASGSIASGALASGSVSSGAIASGAVASGAIASGAVASGAFASGSIVAGAIAAGASSFVKLEDVASASADAGVPAMAIQLATPTDLAGTDADYAMLQMSAGRLWASAKIDTALPAGTNAIGKLAANSGVDIGDVDVTSVIPGTGATNLGKAIDTALGATDTVVGMGVVRDDALTTLTEIDGDISIGRVTSTGRLWTSATIDAALPAGTNGIGKLTANAGVTIGAVEIAAAQTLATVTTVGTVTTITTVAPGAGTIAKAEDVASADADVGVPSMVVRKAVPANSSGTDGDYEFAQASGGRLWTITTENTDSINVAGVATVPKFAVIDLAGSGDNTILAAVASKKIRVLALFLISAGTVNVRFESGASGTALTGQMNLVANAGFVLPYNPLGWFETASATLLNLELSAAISVDGSLTYVEV